MSKSTWEPSWIVENRQPSFIRGYSDWLGNKTKYHWGNVPAIDILRLQANEGVRYGADLSLLFAGA